MPCCQPSRTATPTRGRERAARTRNALVEHGFIWKAEDEGGRYLPGIPSLMSYVLSEPSGVREAPSAELGEWVSRFRARTADGTVSA